MSLQAFNSGCNIVGVFKNGRRFGMCCAWAQMIDFDKLSLLLGAQSDTGKVLEPGDVIGISGLAADQSAIADLFGSSHSLSQDKWAGVPHRREGAALIVEGAKTRMVCRVRDILRLRGIEADAFVLVDVLSSEEDPEKRFLSLEEV